MIQWFIEYAFTLVVVGLIYVIIPFIVNLLPVKPFSTNKRLAFSLFIGLIIAFLLDEYIVSLIFKT